MREINCYKEIIKELREKIEEKNLRIAKEKEKQHRLIIKNEFLAYRSKELTRLKIQGYVSPRSVLLVDSATYSDFFGYLDNTILEIPIKILKIRDFKQSRKSFFRRGAFRDIYKYTLDNGEDVVLKTFNKQLKYSNEKKIIMLSFEAKVASLLSTHPNIIDYHGILATNEETSFIVQSYEPGISMREFLNLERSNDPWVISSLLRGICTGVHFMHIKGFINNNLTPDNIAVRYRAMNYSPVILSLSLACKATTAKPLTIKQQLTFENLIHLPPRIRKGLEAPSFASDRYSVAFFIGNFINKLKKYEIPFCDELNIIHRRCFRMDMILTVEEFLEKTCRCCDMLS